MLSEHNQNRVVVCMDGDQPGQDGMEQILQAFMEGTTFDVQLMRLPSSKNTDPDEFIRAKGIDSFQKLKKYTPFEWMLEKKTQRMDVDLVEVCNDMIPTIRQEKNIVLRNRLIKILSDHTKVTEKDIRRELNRLDNERAYMKDEKVKEIRYDTANRIGRGEDLRFVLVDSLRKVDDIERMFSDSDEDDDEEYIKALEAIKMQCESQENIVGFNLGKFAHLQAVLDGIPKRQCLIALAGKPNIGKTSFLRALSWELAKSNEDVYCLYMSIDDSRATMVPPIIALDQRIDIAKVKNPHYRIHTDEDRKKYESGWANLLHMMKDRYVIKDATHGNTLDALECHINHIKERYPEKKIVVFLDNFHKLGDFPGTDNLRLKNELCSSRIKTMSVHHDIPIIMTVELRRIEDGRRPRNEDIKETGKIEYDADMVWLCHQDLHDHADTEIVWTKLVEGERVRAPILELRIAKNKVGEFKGTLYYRFDPAKNWFNETNIQFMEFFNQKMEETGRIKKGQNDRMIPGFDWKNWRDIKKQQQKEGVKQDA